MRTFEGSWWIRIGDDADKEMMRGHNPESIRHWPEDMPEDLRLVVFDIAGAIAIIRDRTRDFCASAWRSKLDAELTNVAVAAQHALLCHLEDGVKVLNSAEDFLS